MVYRSFLPSPDRDPYPPRFVIRADSSSSSSWDQSDSSSHTFNLSYYVSETNCMFAERQLSWRRSDAVLSCADPEPGPVLGAGRPVQGWYLGCDHERKPAAEHYRRQHRTGDAFVAAKPSASTVQASLIHWIVRSSGATCLSHIYLLQTEAFLSCRRVSDLLSCFFNVLARLAKQQLKLEVPIITESSSSSQQAAGSHCTLPHVRMSSPVTPEDLTHLSQLVRLKEPVSQVNSGVKQVFHSVCVCAQNHSNSVNMEVRCQLNLPPSREVKVTLTGSLQLAALLAVSSSRLPFS